MYGIFLKAFKSMLCHSRSKMVYTLQWGKGLLSPFYVGYKRRRCHSGNTNDDNKKIIIRGLKMKSEVSDVKHQQFRVRDFVEAINC